MMASGAPPRELRAQRQRGQLPAEVTAFVGRKVELSRVAAMLETGRLVSIVGPGGVGKTRIALRAAAQVEERYPDGACLVELAGLDDPDQLCNTVAACLGLPEQDAHSQREAVFGYLRERRRLLLILDTCEHLLDACAELAEQALSQAPGVTLLATSRQPLDVLGEQTFPVAPLPVPASTEATGGGDAVELFAQRAAAAMPGFRVTAANRGDVITLCQRLDGIPLALELAAVRLRALPLAELTQRLDNRFQVLASGRRGAVPRHQTLRTAIEWSHQLCTPAERELWARLSVFAGSFDLDAVHEVCADPGASYEQAVETLVGLVDKSIVTSEPGEGSRYQMLDTLREFGAIQLAASPQGDEVAGRLVSRCLRLARRLDRHLLDDNQAAMFHQLRGEQANIRVALGHTLAGPPGRRDPERDGAELAIALHAYWQISGLVAEGRHWLGKALERFPVPSPQRAGALLARGSLATFSGDIPAALAGIRDGIAMAAGLDEPRIAARGHLFLNLALAAAGQHEEAATAGAEAMRLMRATGNPVGLVAIQPQLAYLQALSGDLDQCRQTCTAALSAFSEHSTEQWIHSYLYLVDGLALFQMPGRQRDSAAEARKALRGKYELGDQLGMAFALEVLGWTAAGQGRAERAAWLLGAADPMWRRAGHRLGGTAILEELHHQAERDARDALGEKRYTTLAAAGARRPLSVVVAHALADADALRGNEPASGLDAEPPAAGGSLTSREHEIAVLVASGLSNREIGVRLFISKRTVDAHVEHIFSKLGISSRVQLTVWLRDKLAEGRASHLPRAGSRTRR
jgi:predicted ATPase/DNA-binding CsgD family transcriptional regulator